VETKRSKFNRKRKDKMFRSKKKRARIKMLIKI